MTLVYDKGNNAKTNQAAVDASPYGFVGSLKANPVPELLEIPMDQYVVLSEFGDFQAYRTTRTVLGVERTVVVTYNESLFLGQWQGEFARLRKLYERLRTIQKGLHIPHRRQPSVASLRKRVAGAMAKAGPHLTDWVTTTVAETTEGLQFTFTELSDYL